MSSVVALECAEVERVVRSGRGKYAVTFVPSRGTVTFSIHSNVWSELSCPQLGEVVMLGKFQYHKGKGWRAEYARRPTIEEVNRYLEGEVG